MTFLELDWISNTSWSEGGGEFPYCILDVSVNHHTCTSTLTAYAMQIPMSIYVIVAHHGLYASSSDRGVGERRISKVTEVVATGRREFGAGSSPTETTSSLVPTICTPIYV